MGKKRITNVSSDQGQKSKKQIFRWEEAYNDLSIATATILREARIKPDQLKSMPDGEIMALEGVTPSILEEIRAKYSADITASDQPQTNEDQPEEEKAPVSLHPRTHYPRTLHGRSKLYKAKLDKKEHKLYSLSDALKALRDLSYSVHKTVELHLNLKDTGLRGEVKLPHSFGKTTRVAIFTPELATQIKKGKLDFDILLAKPADMPKIAPLAKVLGPKGLMPNPKSGTITDKPEERAKQLTSGTTLSYRSEPKAPMAHLVVASLDMKDEQIIDNLKTVLNDIGINKINSAFIKSTMSPSVRLDLNLL